jgi:hypothetical protein
VSRGSADAAARLVGLLHETGHEDAGRAAGWVAGRVRLNDPWDAARLLDAMRAAGTDDAIRALLARDPAGQADLGARLAEGVRLDVPYLAALLRALRTARADGAVRALVARDPARHAHPYDLQETALLVTAMHVAGPEASDVTRALADWAAEHCVIDGPQAVAGLLQAMRSAGQVGAVRRLLDRDPVGQGRFDDPWEAAALLAELRAAGEDAAARRLLARDPARLGKVDSADSVAWLLTELREAAADGAIRTLLARDPASTSTWTTRRPSPGWWPNCGGPGTSRRSGPWLPGWRIWAASTTWLTPPSGWRSSGPAARRRSGSCYPRPGRARRARPPGAMAWLLEYLLAAGADDLARALLDRDPGKQADLGDLRDVARLLAALRAAGDHDAARALAVRAASNAPQASLADPGGTAALLVGLRAAGDHDAAQALLDRDLARQARLDRPQDVVQLIAALRAAGAGDAAGDLARRAAGAGMFGVFLACHPGETVSYRYGCEPDLAPTPPWRWAPPGPRAESGLAG